MTFCAVDFGRDQTALATVGYRLYDENGATTQARTIVGVLDFANGAYGVDVPEAAFDAANGIEWDTGGAAPLFAHQDFAIVKAAIAALAVATILRRRRRLQSSFPYEGA